MGDTATAIFGGGCFWCLQPAFDALEGVLATSVGYCGGASEAPSYREVCGGASGHVEVIQVTFDPGRCSYATLLDTFWRQIDPTDPGGQFADRGSQYRTVIFVADAAQRAEAEASKAALEAAGWFPAPIATSIEAARPFWPAEPEHQGYYRQQPAHFQAYKRGSGRAAFIERHWAERK